MTEQIDYSHPGIVRGQFRGSLRVALPSDSTVSVLEAMSVFSISLYLSIL